MIHAFFVYVYIHAGQKGGGGCLEICRSRLSGKIGEPGDL